MTIVFRQLRKNHLKVSPRGSLYIVSSVAGGGKSTLISLLLKKYPEIHFSISVTSRDVTKTYHSLYGNIEREGKNSPIQGSGADIIKTAGGCGFDKTGEPFLWHTLEPLYGAKIINSVYDELVIEADEHNAEEVLAHVEDAMARAGTEFVSSIVMKAEGKINKMWNKE